MTIKNTPIDQLELSSGTKEVCRFIGAETLESVMLLDRGMVPAKAWKELANFQQSLLTYYSHERAANALQFLLETVSLRDMALVYHDGALQLAELDPETKNVTV